MKRFHQKWPDAGWLPAGRIKKKRRVTLPLLPVAAGPDASRPKACRVHWHVRALLYLFACAVSLSQNLCPLLRDTL